MKNSSSCAVRGEQLTVKYPRAASTAVSGADFSVASGGVCWILGPNGSGKSTLGLTAAGMLPGIVPGKRSGLVRVMEKDPAELEPRQRVETCAYIFQDPSSQLCTLTVESEISLLLENRGISALEIERITSRILADFAIDHLKGRDLISLSGGEKQMVALASAAALVPDVLILDEPCSYLDAENRTRVLGLLKTIKNIHPQLTLMVVEHRTDGLPQADTILTVENGVVSSLKNPPPVWGSDFPSIGRYSRREEPEQAVPLLQVKDLTFSYRECPAPVLDRLNLTLYRGEITVLEGRNGSGKSTLLNLLASDAGGPDRGSVKSRRKRGRIKGSLSGDIAWAPEATLPESSSGVFIVPQNPEHLFIAASVMEELLHASGGCSGTALQALDGFGLNEYGERNPYTLSSGQKRRLNLAIASLSSAPLILMDEPTFGLDGPGVVELLHLHARLRDGGQSLLVVTHDRPFAEAAADRILRLQDGRIAETGEDTVPRNTSAQAEQNNHVAPRSILGRRNPLVRAAGALLIIIGAGFVSSLEATLGWLAAGTLSALAFTSLTPFRFLKRIIPFALIGAGFLWANLLFHRSGGFSAGFENGLLLFCRSLVFGIYSLLFVEDLDPELFSHSLMHYLKLPPKLVYALMIAFRIGPELKAEGELIRRAIRLREYGAKGISSRLRQEFRVYFGIFVAAFRRAGRIAVAMDGRGLDNTPRHLHKVPPLRFSDGLLFIGFCIVLILPMFIFGAERWSSGYF